MILKFSFNFEVFLKQCIAPLQTMYIGDLVLINLNFSICKVFIFPFVKFDGVFVLKFNLIPKANGEITY